MIYSRKSLLNNLIKKFDLNIYIPQVLKIKIYHSAKKLSCNTIEISFVCKGGIAISSEIYLIS